MRETLDSMGSCAMCGEPTNQSDMVVMICSDVCELVWNERLSEDLLASYDPTLDPTFVPPKSGDPF